MLINSKLCFKRKYFLLCLILLFFILVFVGGVVAPGASSTTPPSTIQEYDTNNPETWYLATTDDRINSILTKYKDKPEELVQKFLELINSQGKNYDIFKTKLIEKLNDPSNSYLRDKFFTSYMSQIKSKDNQWKFISGKLGNLKLSYDKDKKDLIIKNGDKKLFE